MKQRQRKTAEQQRKRTAAAAAATSIPTEASALPTVTLSQSQGCLPARSLVLESSLNFSYKYILDSHFWAPNNNLKRESM